MVRLTCRPPKSRKRTREARPCAHSRPCRTDRGAARCTGDAGAGADGIRGRDDHAVPIFFHHGHGRVPICRRGGGRRNRPPAARCGNARHAVRDLGRAVRLRPRRWWRHRTGPQSQSSSSVEKRFSASSCSFLCLSCWSDWTTQIQKGLHPLCKKTAFRLHGPLLRQPPCSEIAAAAAHSRNRPLQSGC